VKGRRRQGGEGRGGERRIEGKGRESGGRRESERETGRDRQRDAGERGRSIDGCSGEATFLHDTPGVCVCGDCSRRLPDAQGMQDRDCALSRQRERNRATEQPARGWSFFQSSFPISLSLSRRLAAIAPWRKRAQAARFP